jgi:ubiquinone/menaquinone biosynthesis C-methylase UbiE
VPDWLADLLREDARPALRTEERGMATVLEPEHDAHAGRFEGLYGGLYDRAIRTDPVRRLASLAFGEAGPLTDLDAFVKKVATGTHAVRGRSPVLLDVPSGGGTLLPRLWRCGYRGRVVASDLGTAMLARAAEVAERVPLDVALLRADAQDLPLADGAVDAAVSLNGLHVLPDPRAFLMELGRVVRPRGRLWMITLVSGGTRRADAVIRVGETTGILPGPPPTRSTLLRWLGDAGFASVAPLGGSGLLGVAATRR